MCWGMCLCGLIGLKVIEIEFGYFKFWVCSLNSGSVLGCSVFGFMLFVSIPFVCVCFGFNLFFDR